MRYWKLNTWEDLISIQLKPVDEKTGESLRQYGDTISNATGIRYLNHDNYVFHITSAYYINRLTNAEEEIFNERATRVDNDLLNTFEVVNMGQPKLTFFDDMFKFVTIDELYSLKSRR